MTFGEYMRQAMTQMGISQAELARRVGVKRSTINGYVSGRRTKIALPILNAILHTLDLDAFEILQHCNELDIDSDYARYVPTDVPWPEDKESDIQEQGHRAFQLNAAFDKLNDLGQTEAVKRVEELTEIPRYTKPNEQGE